MSRTSKNVCVCVLYKEVVIEERSIIIIIKRRKRSKKKQEKNGPWKVGKAEKKGKEKRKESIS